MPHSKQPVVLCDNIINIGDSDDAKGQNGDRNDQALLANTGAPAIQQAPRRSYSADELMILQAMNNSIKNWYEPWHQCYLMKDGREFKYVYDLIGNLEHYEMQIRNHPTMLPSERCKSISKAVARLIDCGNSVLDMDLIVRLSDDEILNEIDSRSITTMELFEAHLKAHKLRKKLLNDYFKKEKSRAPTLIIQNVVDRHQTANEPATTSTNSLRPSSPNPIVSSPNQLQSTDSGASTGGNPNAIKYHQGLSLPVDHCKASRIGSSSSINSLTELSSSGSKASSSSANNNHNQLPQIELLAPSDINGQLDVIHLSATIRSGAFSNQPANSSARLTLLPKILEKIEEFMNAVPVTRERMVNCFELLDTLLIAMEKLDPKYRSQEVQLIAKRLLEPIVKKIYVDDREDLVDFQHAHWIACLLSIIRLMTTGQRDFQIYLSHFANTTDLSSFLKNYLSIVKRLTSKPNNPNNKAAINPTKTSDIQTNNHNNKINIINNLRSSMSLQSPSLDMMPNIGPETSALPTTWIDMHLLASQIFLTSLSNIYHTLKQQFTTNVQVWFSFLDCLLNLICQDALQTGRSMQYGPQARLANELRQTACEYVRCAWINLNPREKQELFQELIDPLLQVCLILDSSLRAVLMPIFYDMMRCNYASQYACPVTRKQNVIATLIETNNDFNNSTQPTATNNHYNDDNNHELTHDLPYNPASQTYSQISMGSLDDDLDSLPPILNTKSKLNNMANNIVLDDGTQITGYLKKHEQQQQQAIMNDNDNGNNCIQDGTVLTRFTHILVDKLYKYVVDQDFGDDSFRQELCSYLAGDTLKSQDATNDLTNSMTFETNNDSSRFVEMAKDTSDLISEFMQICLDLKESQVQDYQNVQLLCHFKLILFFRDKVNRAELYLANLYRLSCSHHKAERFAEAGFTLYEYAKDLPWEKRTLKPYNRIITRFFQLKPNQCLDSMSLKLYLYHTIIGYFEISQLWEVAIPLCRELIDIYQFKLYDYEKLAQLLQNMSEYYHKIMNLSARHLPEYFRVTFYGQGFPECIRNKTMVYRGQPFEKLGDFQANILKQYSNSQLVQSLAKPDESLLAQAGARYLQINACQPYVDLQSKIEPNPGLEVNQLGEHILAYYRHNQCDKFHFSRRMATPPTPPQCNGSKNVAKSSSAAWDSFANLWRERTTLTTNTLPGMLPFFPAYLCDTTIVSPIESAIEDLERVNDRLVHMVNRFKTDKRQVEDIRPLGQLLLGIVDPAVNGGIRKYEEAFLSLDARSTNSNDATSTPKPQIARRTMSNATSYGQHQTTTTTPIPRVSYQHRHSQPVIQQHSNNTLDLSTSPKTLPRASPGRLQRGIQTRASGSNASVLHQVKTQHRSQDDPMLLDRDLDNDETEEGEDLDDDQLNNGKQKSDFMVPSDDQIDKLKQLIAQQVPLLDEALSLHRERVADVMRPQHEHLELSMEKLRRHVIDEYSRYLPPDYVNKLSIRSYRSRLSRSPNRSIRSDLRLLDLNNQQSSSTRTASSNRSSSRQKRMSDVGQRQVQHHHNNQHHHNLQLNTTDNQARLLHRQHHQYSSSHSATMVNASLHSSASMSFESPTSAPNYHHKTESSPMTCNFPYRQLNSDDNRQVGDSLQHDDNNRDGDDDDDDNLLLQMQQTRRTFCSERRSRRLSTPTLGHNDNDITNEIQSTHIVSGGQPIASPRKSKRLSPVEQDQLRFSSYRERPTFEQNSRGREDEDDEDDEDDDDEDDSDGDDEVLDAAGYGYVDDDDDDANIGFNLVVPARQSMYADSENAKLDSSIYVPLQEVMGTSPINATSKHTQNQVNQERRQQQQQRTKLNNNQDLLSL